MTLASGIVDRVQQKGGRFELTSTGFKVKGAPGSMPPDLISDLGQHKPKVRAVLVKENLKSRYQQVFPGDGPGEDELNEPERRVRVTGVCLVWCEELNDCVVFHCDDVEPSTLPQAFVPYSLAELKHIAGLSAEGLRRIHEAKKTGAVITGDHLRAVEDEE